MCVVQGFSSLPHRHSVAPVTGAKVFCLRACMYTIALKFTQFPSQYIQHDLCSQMMLLWGNLLDSLPDLTDMQYSLVTGARPLETPDIDSVHHSSKVYPVFWPVRHDLCSQTMLKNSIYGEIY